MSKFDKLIFVKSVSNMTFLFLVVGETPYRNMTFNFIVRLYLILLVHWYRIYSHVVFSISKKKNAAAAISAISDMQPMAYVDLKRKLEYIVS